jgi:hypothetical protein
VSASNRTKANGAAGTGTSGLARYVDSRSVYLYGWHVSLLLADGTGYEEIEQALLPTPRGADTSASYGVDPRDPFSDSDRSLSFTLGPGVESLPPRRLRQLLELSLMPWVTIDAIPSVDAQGWEKAGSIKCSKVTNGIEVTTTRLVDQTRWHWPMDDWIPLLAANLGLDMACAQETALALAAHMALGNDYLVSPTLAASRASGPVWGSRQGTCTVEEAMFLAGVKTRSYRTAPLQFGKVVHQWTTTGAIYDEAAMDLSHSLRRALGGSLAPTASEEESQCLDHLLAIRGRLRDLLVYRDELVRLERREALGKDWPKSPQPNRSIAGGTGNDLTFRVDQHVTAALNAFTTILDNLAWIVTAREHLTVPAQTVGFDKLIRPKEPFRPTRASAAVQSRMAADRQVGRALALRVLRNTVNHRAGFRFGWVKSVRDQSLQGPEALTIWVPRHGPDFQLPSGKKQPAAVELADLALVTIPEMLIIRPRTLVEACIRSAAALTSVLLPLYSWGPRNWLYVAPKDRQFETPPRLFRGRWHRNLWGVDLCQSPGGIPDAT